MYVTSVYNNAIAKQLINVFNRTFACVSLQNYSICYLLKMTNFLICTFKKKVNWI